MADNLRQLLSTGQLISAPGVYDPLSALVATELDFQCLYLSGYSVSASLLGKPDAGITSFRELVDRLRAITAVSSLPVIADADTGFGGLANVREAVRGYEAAGAGAIQLEDQVYPKRCGHTRNRQVVAMTEMVNKIQVAVESRRSDDLMIVARTDARTEHGLDEALQRGRAYAEAGADILFIESPESEEEMRIIGTELGDMPLLVNMVAGGRTPVLPEAELAALGYRIAIHPIYGLGAATQALRAAYQTLKSEGSQAQVDDINVLNELVGFQEIWDLDDRFS